MPSGIDIEPITEHPFFSIIVLCWNSEKYLSDCLQALSLQTDQDFEVLILDNGSVTPLSPANQRVPAPLNIHWLCSEENLGFAGGNNLVAKSAKGKYLALLNTDAFPAPDWLEQVRHSILTYPKSFFASRLIMADHPDRYDGKGDIYHASGLAWRDSYNSPVSPNDSDHEVFSACAAAAIYPRTAFIQVGGFDEDFFAYIEDVDLGFRLRLAGYRCIYLSKATVRHVGSASTGRKSEFSVYYGLRNSIWAFVKDMPGFSVWILAPAHILVNLLQLLMGIIHRRGRVTLRSKIDALRGLPAILKKRKIVQNSRVAPAMSVLRAMDWNPFSPMVKWLQR